MNDDTPDPGFARRSELLSRTIEPPASGTCAHCGQHTNNGTAHWVTRDSGPDARTVIHTNPAECPAV